jgi:hypothetical protein
MVVTMFQRWLGICWKRSSFWKAFNKQKTQKCWTHADCSHQKSVFDSARIRRWWRERTNKMQLTRCLSSNFLSQHVLGIIMPIIRRIRPCPTACGVLPGCAGCGWLSSCGAALWDVCTVWQWFRNSTDCCSRDFDGGSWQEMCCSKNLFRSLC